MVPDVIEPSSLRFRCYEPVILGGFMVTTKLWQRYRGVWPKEHAEDGAQMQG